MNKKAGILSTGLRMVMRNKRYLGWFYVLNLLLSILGASALRSALGGALDTTLYSQKLLHGFDVFTFLGLISRPEFLGHAVARPHLYFTFVFLFLSVLFMPGVLDAYASERRLSREDFYATCGRNLWRFVRIFLINLVIAGFIFAVLAGINGALGKAADKSSNEKLEFYVQLAGAILIFLVMTWVRIWFDIAQTETVIRDEGRVRKSIRSAFLCAGRALGRLLGSYVAISILALIVLLFGLWVWDVVVPPASVFGAFVVGQIILFVWLAARFWQRACAVAFCVARAQERRVEEPFTPTPAPLATTPLSPQPGPAT